MPESVAGGDAPQAFPLPRGSYEDALQWVGRERELAVAEVPVNWPMIKTYAAMLEDPNSSYWDERFAEQAWGRVIAPPGMLHVWLMALQWRPEGADPPYPLCAMVPLPGDTLINTRTRTTFHAPMRVGDHLSMLERVESISPEKRTRLGRGHFVTTVARYSTQHDVVIGEHVNTLLRFDREQS